MKPTHFASALLALVIGGVALPATPARAVGQSPPAGAPPAAHATPPAAAGQPSGSAAQTSATPLDLTGLGEQLAKQLGLTAAQRIRITGLTQSFQKQHADALQRVASIHEDIAALQRTGHKVVAADVRALQEKHGNPERELLPAVQKLRQQILAELTEAQRRQLEKLRKELAAPRG